MHSPQGGAKLATPTGCGGNHWIAATNMVHSLSFAFAQQLPQRGSRERLYHSTGYLRNRGVTGDFHRPYEGRVPFIGGLAIRGLRFLLGLFVSFGAPVVVVEHGEAVDGGFGQEGQGALPQETFDGQPHHIHGGPGGEGQADQEHDNGEQQAQDAEHQPRQLLGSAPGGDAAGGKRKKSWTVSAISGI